LELSGEKVRAGEHQVDLLVGLGGVGKTQTAIDFAYRSKDKYSRIIWVPAETKNLAVSRLFNIASELRIPGEGLGDEFKVIESFHSWLLNNPEFLLILDNATSENLVDELIPVTATGHILITSRSDAFQKIGATNSLRVLPFTAEEAKVFLMERTNRTEALDPVESLAADQIIELLGRLPLALEQCGAYIKALGIKFIDYLTVYDKRSVLLFKKSKPVMGDYSASVETTWLVNIAQVMKGSRAAGDLLRLSSFLASERIPFEVFAKGSSHLPQSIRRHFQEKDATGFIYELLEKLNEFSLIEIEPNDQSFSLHRLVQEVVLSKLGAKTRLQYAEQTVQMMVAALPPTEPSHWIACERMLPHVSVVLSHSWKYGTDKSIWPLLCYWTGEFLLSRGEYRGAVVALDRATRGWVECYGPHDPRTACGLRQIGWAFFSVGDLERSEQAYTRALRIFEYWEGLFSYNVGWTLNGLAVVYRTIGEYNLAEQMYKRALCVLQLMGGVDSDEYGIAMDNLGVLLGVQNRTVEALACSKKVLKVHESIWGPDSLEVARDLVNSAAHFRRLEMSKEAEDALVRARGIFIAHLGEEHFETAVCVSSLGCLYAQTDDRREEGKRLIEESTPLMEKGAGEKNPHVITNYNSLGNIELEDGQIMKADRHFRFAYNLSLAVYPMNPAMSIEYFRNLAETLARQNRFQDAISEAEILRRRCEDRFGYVNKYHLGVMGIIEELYFRMKDFKNSIATCEAVISAIETHGGANNPILIPVLNSLERTYREMGRLTDAAKMRSRVSSLQKYLPAGEQNESQQS
jgi:tetratricopeptide (TPR) repeat protein